MEIDLSADLRPLLSRLQNVERQIPFVIANALTKTAVKTKPAIREEMIATFDRPTRYTLNSLFVRPAKKADANPSARVWIKDSQNAALDTRQFTGGTPAAEYLWPQIAGGSRPLKRFEIRLKNAGILPAGMYVVPGRECKLDRYGNPDLGQMVAVLAKLGTIREGASLGGRRRNSRFAGAQYFVSHRGRARGIWQRLPNRRLAAIYIFVDHVAYRRRFDFARVARESALALLPSEFDAAIRRALEPR